MIEGTQASAEQGVLPKHLWRPLPEVVWEGVVPGDLDAYQEWLVELVNMKVVTGDVLRLVRVRRGPEPLAGPVWIDG